MSATPAQKKRLRGVILKLVQQQHAKQQHRHDDYSLMAVLDKLGFDVHLNLVRELVQDLIERRCLAAQQDRDTRSGEVLITKIQICPRGRDVLEGNDSDAAILVEAE
jgi:hypothetical protein